MKNLYCFFILLLVILSSLNLKGQSDTWPDIIYPVLQLNCSGSGCHSDGSRPDFNVSLSADSLYDGLINIAPQNPYARDSVQNFYIVPGEPVKSFLLRKIANCIDGTMALADPFEGAGMPEGRPPLAMDTIEIIRQWILAGAPEIGSGDRDYVKPNVYKQYYSGDGLPRMEAPDAPSKCEGFQIHLGPIFLEPNEEQEFWNKIDLGLNDTTEIRRIEVNMNDFSHHFILYKYKPGTAQNWPAGIKYLNPFTAFDSDKDFVLAWQDNHDIWLPNGTAYFWPEETNVDLNYHVKNYNQNKVLAAEIYINIYTQPRGTAEVQMKADLINNPAIFLMPSQTPEKLVASINKSDVSLWNITSHAHSLAIDYDVYLKENNNSRGAQIYEGMFDYEAGFNTGVYEWEHPPIRFFDPFLDLGPYKGLIHEATYLNNSGQLKTFGFTTNDEMMIIFINYVEGTFDPTQATSFISSCPPSSKTDPCSPDSTNSINNFNLHAFSNFKVYPNPFQGLTNISYSLTEKTDIKLEVYNLFGELIAILIDEQQRGGNYNIGFDPSQAGYPSGTYLIRLSLNGQQSTKKVMQFN